MHKNQMIAFVVLLAVLGAASFLYASSNKEVPAAREIAFLVNGQPLYQDQIEREIATLPPEQRSSANLEKAIDFLIEKTLLLQEAKKAGLSAGTDEIKALYESYPDPEADVKQQNLTMAEFMKRLEEQVVINKLLEQKTAAGPVIKQEEVQQIYDLNYKERNISFEDAESEIVQFIIDNRQEILRRSYILSLKNSAIVEKLT